MRMINKLCFIALILMPLFGLAANVPIAQPIATLADLPKPTPEQPTIIPSPPALNSKAYILLDADSGRIIAEKNSHMRLPPASLTKLMTLYIVDQALMAGKLHENDTALISEKAWRSGGSRMFVKLNDHVPVKDLLQGIIVDSGNDACVAIAEHIAGDETTFAGVMNQQAKNLGMQDSNFLDSTGLPNPNHYTTAFDMAILTRALIKSFPEQYALFKQKWFAYNNIKQPNRNRLLWWDNSVDGLKTGHTDEAGFCLVASAKRQNMRLIAVVMGAPSDHERATEAQQLLNYGFHFYETHKLYSAGTALAKPRIWKGQEKNVEMGTNKDIFVTIPTGEYKNLVAQVSFPDILQAPIEKGQNYGDLTVKLKDQLIANVPIAALQDDPKGGIFRRMNDSISLTFHRLFGKKTT